MTAGLVRIRIESNDDLDAARESAVSENVEIMEAPGDQPGIGVEIEPITAVLIGTGALALGKFILSWWEKRRGGLVIDMREGTSDQIYRDRDVPWGYVIVFPADGGEVKIETKDEPKDSIERIIEAVLTGVVTSAADVAEKALDEGLEDKKVESTTEEPASD